jgi:hypothetical protein
MTPIRDYSVKVMDGIASMNSILLTTDLYFTKFLISRSLPQLIRQPGYRKFMEKYKTKIRTLHIEDMNLNGPEEDYELLRSLESLQNLSVLNMRTFPPLCKSCGKMLARISRIGYLEKCLKCSIPVMPQQSSAVPPVPDKTTSHRPHPLTLRVLVTVWELNTLSKLLGVAHPARPSKKTNNIETKDQPAQPSISSLAFFKGLSKLKTLVIYHTTDYVHLWEFIGFCKKLESLTIPFNYKMDMRFLVEYIEERKASKLPLEPRHLKRLQLDPKKIPGYSYQAPFEANCPNVDRFIQLISEEEIHILNADPLLLNYIIDYFPDYVEPFGRQVVSVFSSSLPAIMKLVPMPILNELFITTTFTHYDQWCHFPSQPDPVWPCLKELSFYLNGMDVDTMRVAEFILSGEIRPSVQFLHITVDTPRVRDNQFEIGSLLILPKDIVKNFPNMRTLELIRWTVQPYHYLCLWTLLSNECKSLRNIVLVGCGEALTDFGFIGYIPESPVFMGLARMYQTLQSIANTYIT